MGNNTIFPRLYGTPTPGEVPAALARIQDNISTVLGPTAAALQATPIMGAPPPAWIRPPTLNGWIATGGFAEPAFHRDALGYVHVKGAFTNSLGVANAAVIFTLPIGYRPGEVNLFGVVGAGAAPQFVTIALDGSVTPTSTAAGDNKHLNFTFLAEV